MDLFIDVYNAHKRLSFVMTKFDSSLSEKRCLVYINGLVGGFFENPYVKRLASELRNIDVIFAQVFLFTNFFSHY